MQVMSSELFRNRELSTFETRLRVFMYLVYFLVQNEIRQKLLLNLDILDFQNIIS